jgi:hypothetical protein
MLRNDDRNTSSYKWCPQHCGSHNGIDDSRGFVRIDGDDRPISRKESRIGASYSMDSIAVQSLVLDRSCLEVVGERAPKLHLEGSTTPAQIRGRGDVVTRIKG